MRRKSYYFKTDQGDVRALSYSMSEALALLRERGYTGIRRDETPAAWRIDKARATRLAREMGVTWPITFKEGRSRLDNGSCHTKLVAKSHTVTVSRYTDDPERTIRHEIGHAVDNERRLVEVGNPLVLQDRRRRELRTYGYEASPAEVAARSYENFRLDYPVVRGG